MGQCMPDVRSLSVSRISRYVRTKENEAIPGSHSSTCPCRSLPWDLTCHTHARGLTFHSLDSDNKIDKTREFLSHPHLNLDRQRTVLLSFTLMSHGRIL